MIVSDKNWQLLVNKMEKETAGGIIYIIGSNDSGKSTLCRFLGENLSKDFRTAYVDCDPGQSLIGPPTTIGLEPLFPSDNEKPNPYFYFVGSTTPRGHLLQSLAGIKKLSDKAVTIGSPCVTSGRKAPGCVARGAAG